MKIFKKEICDEVVDVFVYGDKIRFYCEGGFYPTGEDWAVPEAPSDIIGITKCQDGSFSVEMQKLVPFDLSSEALEDFADNMINDMESILHIPDGYLSSSMWLAGHGNETYDHLLPPEELAYLNAHKEDN